ncbi:MAG: GatB/YqeY domain-containing protein [Acidobacteriota bacterium]|nr:GatB/YqeY domain-containing protein [Acidobacteriota bacterium]
MSTVQARLQDEIKTALKAGDKERTSTLRMLLTEVKNEKIRAGQEVDEDAFLTLVRRSIKQRQDSVEQYRKGGRDASAEKEEREIALLETFLPAQASEDEIRDAIRQLVREEDLSGNAAMGRVMKAIMARFGAATDGRTVSRIAREVLAENG